MSKRRAGLLLMIAGVLALAAGLGLGGYNLWDNHRAGAQADALLDVIVRHQEEAASADQDQIHELLPELPSDDSYRELPVLKADGCQ